MRTTLAVSAGALALLGLAVLHRPAHPARARSASAPPAESSSGPALAAPTPPPPAPPAEPLLDTLRLDLRALRATLSRHAGGALPYTPGEFEEVMALERGIEALGVRLARAAAESSDGGDRLIKAVLDLEDDEDALRVARMIGANLGEPVRARLAAALAGPGTPRERRVALAVLGRDSAQSGLLALLVAARSDPDPAIRAAALDEARARAARHPDDAPLVHASFPPAPPRIGASKGR